MPERRIRVRGRQRTEIDLDLVVQALLLIGEQRWRQEHGIEEDDDDSLAGGQGQAAEGDA
jgi:hypothetical protein